MLSRRRALIAVVVATALIPSTAQAAVKHCTEPGAKWQRATPEEVGMDPAKIADAVSYATQNNSTAVRIIRNGCLVAEDTLNPESVGTPSQSFSLAKSVVSMVFGRAWTLGLIGPDDPVGSLFPEADAQHGALLVRHLATMTSGAAQYLTRDFNLAMPDRVRDGLTVPLIKPPGTTYNYFQTGPPMLAASVTRAAREDFQTFAQRELFTPIGIEPGSWTWTRDPAGNTAGFWGLMMSPDDYARLGELLRRGGVWRGDRLLSRSYVHDALEPIRPFGCYAMLIWRQATPRCNWDAFLGLPEDMWQFNGLQGQLVTAFPSQELMTVRTGLDPSQANWAEGPGGAAGAEREFHDRVLRAITDTPVGPQRKPEDPKRPSTEEQIRGAENPSGEPGGAVSGAVQDPLPPAGPRRARAVLFDDAPVKPDSKGRIAVRVHCPPVGGGCRGTLTTPYAAGRRGFDVAAGKTGVARVRLTARALRRLRRTGSLTVDVHATTRDATAAGTRTSETIEVRRR